MEKAIIKMIKKNLINCEGWGYSDSIILIKTFNTICSKFDVKLKIEISSMYFTIAIRDISFIQNYENICFRALEIFDTPKTIRTDTVYILCDEFKEFVINEKNHYDIILAHEFDVVKILDKEYYRLWFD